MLCCGTKSNMINCVMSTAVKLQPHELRASLHGKIDRLSDDELVLAERQLEAFELKRRLDELCDDAGEEWRAGRMTQEMVEEAVRKYRAAHPCRTPGCA